MHFWAALKVSLNLLKIGKFWFLNVGPHSPFGAVGMPTPASPGCGPTPLPEAVGKTLKHAYFTANSRAK